jgi:short-subunit dehydrogenase
MNGPRTFALVTGASSGIGWHISEELAGRGYNILALSNQPEKLRDLKEYLEKQYQIKVHTLNMDLAREEAAEEIHEYCSVNALPVEVLINNAGMLIYGELLEVGTERIKELIHLHITTPALLCRLLGKTMADKGSGYILNVSSISAVMPYPTISLYGPSKTFIRKYSRALRTEFKTVGVNVTCLIPGATDTSLYDSGVFDVERGKRFGLVSHPSRVAKSAVRSLFRKRSVCIPGILNKIVVFIFPILPSFIISILYFHGKGISGKQVR